MLKSSAVNMPNLLVSLYSFRHVNLDCRYHGDLRIALVHTAKVSLVRSRIDTSWTHLMTFAINASMWKIFFDPNRILSSYSSVLDTCSAREYSRNVPPNVRSVASNHHPPYLPASLRSSANQHSSFDSTAASFTFKTTVGGIQ